jgi:TorA maturation chaperone TorD
MANLTQQNTTIAKLYTALFNRAPDAAGFTFWVQAFENGASIGTLAQGFLTSPESLAIYPTSQTNAQFVTAFYTSVFGRAPDPEGLAFWAAALASNGGSASPAARSLLIQQITEVVATSLSTKPAGISDTAYAQTVADRAMFANKIEFGVYFATELKSNDTTLAKSAMLLVTNIPGSLAAAREFATGGPAPVPTPTLAITSADLVADITAKLAAYPGASGTVDALNMSAAQLAAVAAGTSKIAANGITNLTLPVGDALITDTFATALLGKTSAAKIDATNADSAKLILLSNSLANVVDEGIIGTLGLDNGLSVAQLTTLLGAKTGLAANVQVNATSMDPTKLAVLTAAGAKVDGITGALSFTSAINETDIGTLAGKYTGTTAVVNASTMTTAQITAVVAAAGKIAAGGITGLTLDLASVDDAATALLLSKATGANVVATGGSVPEIASLVTNLGNIAANGITGTLAITGAVTGTDMTALLAKYTGTGVTADVTSMVAAQLNALSAANTKISTTGITGVLALNASEDAVAANLLAKAAVGTLGVVATGGTVAEVASVVTNLGNIAANGITGTLAITNAVVDTNITALLAKYAGTTATVDVTSMNKAQLDTLLVSTAKISTTGITGVLALNASEDAVAANLLAKASAGTLGVVATGGTTAEVASVVTNLGNIAANGITGTLTITSDVTGTNMTALLAKYSGTTATVDVTSMNKAQLDALLVSTAKISTTGITGTLALNASEDAVAANLMAKAAAGLLNVVATGATANEVASIETNIAKITTTGISGDLAITNAVTDVAGLFAKYSGTTATVTADSMSAAKLVSVADAAIKVQSVTGMALALGDGVITDTVTSTLLTKSSAASASVTATGASDTEMASVVTNISKIADGGLGGVVVLTYTQVNDVLTKPTLSTKLAVGSSLTITDAGAGVNGASSIDTSGFTQAVTVIGGSGADTITLAKASDSVRIASTTDSRYVAGFSGASVDASSLDKVSLSTGSKILLSTTNGAYGTGLALSADTVVIADKNVASADNFADMYTGLNADPIVASSATTASAYLVRVAAGSLQGTYLVVNDTDTSFTVSDFIISLVGFPASGVPAIEIA